jgi:hypothetical protein
VLVTDVTRHAESSDGSSTRARGGSTARHDRAVTIGGSAVVALLALGWAWSFTQTRTASAAALSRGGIAGASLANVTAALTNTDGPTAAYVTGAALDALTARMLASAHGTSGKLQAVIEPVPHALTPDTVPPGGRIEYSQGETVSTTPRGAGIWNVLLEIGGAIRPIANLHVITLLPFRAKSKGHIGSYFVGDWPSEHGAKGPAKAPAGAYGNPAGFIEVTAQNRGLRVSEHFTLGDFVTHDQPNVWPKYIVLQPKLVDKLELVLSDLSSRGFDVHGVHVMSGFRSPQYNYTGGNTAGRASLSRHMFGDASDIYIDSDGDGQMDDLNHDGRISIADAGVIGAAVDRVEAAHPELVGGYGLYTAAPGHGPFIHIDTRGYKARWTGTSGG